MKLIRLCLKLENKTIIITLGISFLEKPYTEELRKQSMVFGS